MILIKKAGDGSKMIKGCWDSIHVVEVQEKSSGKFGKQMILENTVGIRYTDIRILDTVGTQKLNHVRLLNLSGFRMVGPFYIYT